MIPLGLQRINVEASDVCKVKKTARRKITILEMS
jgi:hypothetical protein